MKREHPTLRDELLLKLEKIREEKILEENRRDWLPGPGRFTSS